MFFVLGIGVAVSAWEGLFDENWVKLRLCCKSILAV